MVLNDKKLDFWIAHNYNVILRGAHGVGKSTQILDAFSRNKLKWMYFSAPTMDPWVDFIGVPKEVKSDTGKSYLELIRPKQFEDDDVEAIMFDEFNRASSKIRNAVMELIQFKSINGRKFNKLRMVWAAINPENDGDEESDYDVETLDPAQLDRFHIIVNVDNKPSSKFFRQKFGEDGNIGVEWWNTLKPEQKKILSPRRLDYALSVYKDGGDINDVVDENIPIVNLVTQLKNGSFRSILESLYDKNDEDGIRSFFLNTNNFNGTIDWIKPREELVRRFSRFFPSEEFCHTMLDSSNFRKIILSDVDNLCPDKNILLDLIATKTTKATKKVIKEIKNAIDNFGLDTSGLATFISKHYRKSCINYSCALNQTYGRTKCLQDFISLNPTLTSPEIMIDAAAIVLTVFDRTTTFKKVHTDAALMLRQWMILNSITDSDTFFDKVEASKMPRVNGASKTKLWERVAPISCGIIGTDQKNQV